MSPKNFSWAEGPIPLIETPKFKSGATDQYTAAATQMALVHNCFVRAFNSIYQQASHVSPSEYKNFIRYAYACFEGIELHHAGEENSAFPAIEAKAGEKGLMAINIAQHEAFHSGLAEFGTYLSALLNNNTTSEFSGQHLVSIMDTFLGPLSTHLHDEIPTLIALASFGDKLDMGLILKEEADKVLKTMSKTTVIPGILLNHDVEYERGSHPKFPDIPGHVKWILMRICPLVHRGWWKFATCDTSGRPKELYCA